MTEGLKTNFKWQRCLLKANATKLIDCNEHLMLSITDKTRWEDFNSPKFTIEYTHDEKENSDTTDKSTRRNVFYSSHTF